MSNVFTREELLSLLRKQEKDFTHHIQERIQSRNWRMSPEYRGVTSIEGKIHINSSYIEAVQQIMAESAIDGILSFIDILSNSSSPNKSNSELEALKTRMGRLEMEFFKMLPPDFTNPSSENPSNN